MKNTFCKQASTVTQSNALEILTDIIKDIGPGFHADTLFESYVKGTALTRTYTDEEANIANINLELLHKFLGKDIYKIGISIMEKLYPTLYEEEISMTPNEIIDYLISVLDNLTEISDSYDYNFFIKEGAREKIESLLGVIVFNAAYSEEFMYKVQGKVQTALGKGYVVSVDEPVGKTVLIDYVGLIEKTTVSSDKIVCRFAEELYYWQNEQSDTMPEITLKELEALTAYLDRCEKQH